VIDASVMVAWLVDDPDNEPDSDIAAALMTTLARRRGPVLQPAHWMAEVAGVLARRVPAAALSHVNRLQAMDLPIAHHPSVMSRAVTLAIETGQHVMDTLYHAVALETPDTVLITADRRYLAKAAHYGCIRDLTHWQE
jgi:predicted nucleic acid-binding protein